MFCGAIIMDPNQNANYTHGGVGVVLNHLVDTIGVFVFSTPFLQKAQFFGLIIRYLPAPVNSVESAEFTGTFTIPYLNNEYTNQTRSLLNILFRILQ